MNPRRCLPQTHTFGGRVWVCVCVYVCVCITTQEKRLFKLNMMVEIAFWRGGVARGNGLHLPL